MASMPDTRPWDGALRREIDAYMKLTARTDAGTASYWHTGFVYGVVPGAALLPLMRYAGLYRIHVEPDGARYRTTTVDGVVFESVDSARPLDTFRNPVTRRSVPVQHLFEGPLTFRVSDGSEQLLAAPANGGVSLRPRAWRTLGPQAIVSRDIHADVSAAAKPHRRGSSPQLMVLATFQGEIDELRSAKTNSVARTLLSQEFAGPWWPWLGMENRPGTLVCCGTGQKIAPDLSDLTRAMRARVAAHHPAVLESVEHWGRSSAA